MFLENGDGSFRPPLTIPVGIRAWSVVVGDFNSDQALDLAVGSFVSGTTIVAVLQGNGDGTFRPAINFGAGDGPGSVAVAELNRVGVPDLAVANYYSNTVSLLLSSGRADRKSTRLNSSH